ncbi:reverse transcriptase SR3-right [Elysia marginata]|uniref:Reverse transcriptase SR3-right n=1 Tax=Elysia marginata TaxID=1093978 RepID=A0AAV4EYD9_9GAST|nr:reverse transcriptase SR3-right [Elysia marginata]
MDCYFVAVVGLVYSIHLDGDTIQDAIVVKQLMERSQTRCNPLLPCSSLLVWQRLTEKTLQKSQRYAPAVRTSGKYPIDWKEGHLVKIPKKGDLSRCEHYRGITLLSTPGKVFNRVLLNRIKAATDPKLRDEQAGFRSNRSTTDQIATLRIVVEQSLEWNSPLIVNFLDYKKAFDSIDRELLWKIMRNYGIPENFVSLVRKMYDGTCCRIVHDGH